MSANVALQVRWARARHTRQSQDDFPAYFNRGLWVCGQEQFEQQLRYLQCGLPRYSPRPVWQHRVHARDIALNYCCRSSRHWRYLCCTLKALNKGASRMLCGFRTYLVNYMCTCGETVILQNRPPRSHWKTYRCYFLNSRSHWLARLVSLCVPSVSPGGPHLNFRPVHELLRCEYGGVVFCDVTFEDGQPILARVTNLAVKSANFFDHDKTVSLQTSQASGRGSFADVEVLGTLTRRI